MKFLLSWLKDYIDINASATEIGKILTSIGIEVDAIEPLSMGFENVVVAAVLDVSKHPNADKLCVATVSDGTDTYQVVCGAPNCRKGIKTALAKVGATLYDRTGKAFKIKKGKIRDVESSGMLCSEDELLISNDGDGIIEFAEHMQVGADVAELYGDVVFEVSLTPNLGHCMSLVGIAKELSAATEIPFKLPLIALNESTATTASKIKVTVEAQEQAPLYSCRLVENIELRQTPEWMQKRLKASGVRPINAIVDVTNYVSLEFGQPLHAFDFEKIHGNEIVVKQAAEGEKFISLDSQERVLESSDLIICDRLQDGNTRTIALAGVMGGANTEVSESTRAVLIESAYFDPTAIRRTSRRLALHTDAARRFERVADPSLAMLALDRATALLHAIVGGSICRGAVQESFKVFVDKHIRCRIERLNALLGATLSVGEVENIFTRLGFTSKWDSQGFFDVQAPIGRADINEEIDLIEEVARIYGYDNIPRSKPKYRSSNIPHAPIFTFEKIVRARLIAVGMQEVMTCNLIGPAMLKVFDTPLMPEDVTVHVLNPTSQEQSILRTSLMPGLLQAAKYNYDHQNHDMSFFEIGRIHFKEEDSYKEESCLAVLLTGKSAPHHWLDKPHEYDFYHLKGLVEDICGLLGFRSLNFRQSNIPALHSGRQIAICIGSVEVGWMGEVHPHINHRLDMPQRMFFAEINLHDLYRLREPEQKIAELPLYPSSLRDWTITMDKDFPVQPVLDFVKTLELKFFESMVLLDVYASAQLGSQNQNVTFRFVYRDRKKTIAQQEVDDEHAVIVKAIEDFVMKTKNSVVQ
jgi:phenylalanyl-tRNA synthetase beta chain